MGSYRRAGLLTVFSMCGLWMAYLFTGWYRSRFALVTFVPAVLVVAAIGLVVAYTLWRRSQVPPGQ